MGRKCYCLLVILFENQIQTASTSSCRTQVQPAASFLVCFLIFIEYKTKFFIDLLILNRFTVLLKPIRPLLNCSTNNALRLPSNSCFRLVTASKIFVMLLVTVMLDISIKCSENCAENRQKPTENRWKPHYNICIPLQKVL